MSASASAPSVAVEVALPPPVPKISALAKLSSPLAVARLIAPSSASADAPAPTPDAELTAWLPSFAVDPAEPWSEAWAVALLGGPTEASHSTAVPSAAVSVTFVLVVEHDSWSDFANASVRATVRASTIAAIAGPI
jgi:hypothetical protein